LWGAGHVIPYDGDPFFEALQEVYDEISERDPPTPRTQTRRLPAPALG
jgi:hypothetical protein